MITKELFNECIQAFKEFSEWEGKLYDLGINLLDSFEMSNLLTTFDNLLAYCCEEQYTEDSCDSNLIDSFMYDLNFGAFAKSFASELETTEDLWSAIVAVHPNVISCQCEQKSYDDVDDVADTIMEIQDEI